MKRFISPPIKSVARTHTCENFPFSFNKIIHLNPSRFSVSISFASVASSFLNNLFRLNCSFHLRLHVIHLIMHQQFANRTAIHTTGWLIFHFSSYFLASFRCSSLFFHCCCRIVWTLDGSVCWYCITFARCIHFVRHLLLCCIFKIYYAPKHKLRLIQLQHSMLWHIRHQDWLRQENRQELERVSEKREKIYHLFNLYYLCVVIKWIKLCFTGECKFRGRTFLERSETNECTVLLNEVKLNWASTTSK